MIPRRLRSSLAATSFLLLLAAGSNAGQRRVDVGSGGLAFGPQDQTLNLGDHVTWIWVGAGHNVENGVSLSDPNQGTIFNTAVGGSTAAFTWKADQTGTIPYFCAPHFNFGMTGSLMISSSGVSVSNFRITEVQYDEASGHDRVEVANLGADFGDLGRYRISINGTTAVQVPLSSVIVLSGTGRVVVHTNQGSAGSTQTDLFMGAIGNLSATGSIALFAPNTISPSLTDPTQIVDFVQWGAGNQPNAATAVAAGIWPSVGEFVAQVPTPGPDGPYDLTLCGSESEQGAARWRVAHPNFGAQSLCATPTQATTWGRIKLLYR